VRRCPLVAIIGAVPRIRTAVAFPLLAALLGAGCAGASSAGPPRWSAPSAPSASATPSAGAASPAAVVPGATRPGTTPPVVDHGSRAAGRVALTFDADMTDAMLHNLRTGRVRSYANLAVLDTLERERVPATFFVTGQWAEQYPDVTRRIAGNPRFELANHSYEHAAFTGDCYGLPRVPANLMTEDVAKTFTVLAPYGGRQTRYFRFPGLCHDPAALRALAPLGVTVVDGDVVSGDPFARSAEPVVDAVLTKVRPGSIVIMHVTEANAQYTDEALPRILAGIRARGLTPVTLSELLAPG
jgi:peptidoglycan/xylan/chitin deacetylase (PgdA/CDA1 family)